MSTQESYLRDIALAIRTVKQNNEPIKARNFATEILSLEFKDAKWEPHPDWLKADDTPEEAICEIYRDGAHPGVNFTVVTTSGQYNVKVWGGPNGTDILMDNNFNSNTACEIVFQDGTGKLCSLGYTTFKVLITAPSGRINRITKNRLSYLLGNESHIPILWAVHKTPLHTNHAGSICNGAVGVYAGWVEAIELPYATTIANHTLSWCLNLRYLTAPRVITMGDSNLYNSYMLFSVNLPELKTIGQQCFSGMYSIVRLELPKLETTGTNCFINLRSAKHLYLPSLKSCAGIMLTGASNLSELDLPSLETTGNTFCLDCTNLKTINAPKLIYGGDQFCQNAYRLDTLNAPLLEELGNQAFNYCYVFQPNLPSLKKIKHSFMRTVTYVQKAIIPPLQEVDMGTGTIGMFYDNFTISEIDTSAVNINIPFNGVHEFYNCQLLRQLDLRGFCYSRFRLMGKAGVSRIRLDKNIEGFDTSLLLPIKPGQWEGVSPQVTINNTLMTADQLNALFEYMPQDQVEGKTWDIKNNFGSATCDISILTNKGCTVIR